MPLLEDKSQDQSSKKIRLENATGKIQMEYLDNLDN